MDSLPPRFGEAYERVKNAGGRKNRKSSGNLREQVVHVLPTPVTTDGKSVDVANQVATRNSLQLQSITAILDMPKDTWMKTDLSGNKDRQVGKSAKIREQIELLRTPVASEAAGGAVAPDVAKANGQTLRLSGQMIDMVAPDQLPKLPTPTVSDQYTANLASTQQKEGSMHSVTLAQVFHKPDLFPTPVASDWKNGRPGQGYGPNLPAATESLMPTPTTRDYKDGSQPHERDGKVQTDTVARAVFNSGEVLLGTPRATAANSSSKQVELGAPKARIEDQVKLFNTPTTMDAKATNNPEIAQKFLDQGRQTCLTYDVATNWGKFEPAIRRWEAIIGRPAPEPTKPDGKDGNHRLSSKFTEWMMGLPDGWITDIGLKRNDELKACGNGVVPQQAELALSLLGIKEILERN
jgi:hypothetical protein